MWVKICGNTNLEDALLAAELGADAVGFVFAPGRRQVTPEQVARMTPHLPTTVERVGVFTSWSAHQIVATVNESQLTSVQLHAAFDPELVKALRANLEPQVTIVQVLHWPVLQDGDEASLATRLLEEIDGTKAIDRVLIDSKTSHAVGGTGVSFDWKSAQSVFASHPRLILAGGLQPQNVREAIDQLHPWGVDVVSGVEEIAGRKSRDKLTRFMLDAKANVVV